MQYQDQRNELTTVEIFDKMRPLICYVISSLGESSGFYIDNEVVVTAAHNIPLDCRDVQVGKGNQSFFVDFETKNVECAKSLDLYALRMPVEVTNDIAILPDDFELKEGLVVYFAGFPLGQNDITFHKGIISSISSRDGNETFTIDGTIVLGSSGGPVIIQHEGQLFFIGVIISEVADLSPEDLRTIKIVDCLSAQQKHQNRRTGFNRTVTIQGNETIILNDFETLSLGLNLIRNNLSTGIGKAIHIKHYRDLFSDEVKLRRNQENDVPVSRGTPSITGRIVDSKGTAIAKYMEVFYGKGKGNRGIRITLCDSNSPSMKYKFSPNPHTISKYNKKQKELYFKAALAILQNQGNQVEFYAYKTRFIATLQIRGHN